MKDLLGKFYSDLQGAFKIKQTHSKLQESTKLGWLRGGNSGCITSDGKILGIDPRTSVLRALGIQSDSTFDDDLLFQAGHLNEDGIAEYLSMAGIKHQREEECQIQWECTVGQEDIDSLTELGLLPDGCIAGGKTSVSGRPDFKLKGYDNGKDVGIELKGIFGTSTLMEVSNFIGGVPKTENVCQAAHYSWQSNKVKWILQYVNRSWHTVMYYGLKRFPHEHRAIRRDDKGKPIVVSPCMSLYELSWDGDTLLIDGEPTLVTASGIELYYKYLTACISNGIIPQKHSRIDVFGNRLAKDKQSDYYKFDDADTSSFNNWVDSCKHITGE